MGAASCKFLALNRAPAATATLTRAPIHRCLAAVVAVDAFKIAEVAERGPADLYPETITSLKRWTQEGLKLAVYSSGSIKAQQLLYAHTTSGDLRELFSGWFDTHTGSKKETTSYITIANQLKIPAASITFISDNGVECDAAHEAGMQVLFSLRPGNPDQNPRGHRVIRSLEQVDALI